MRCAAHRRDRALRSRLTSRLLARALACSVALALSLSSLCLALGGAAALFILAFGLIFASLASRGSVETKSIARDITPHTHACTKSYL